MFHTFYHEQERRKRVQGWQRIRHDPFFSGKWKQRLQVDGQSQQSSEDTFRELQPQ
jgi:hypothetical protein